MLPLSLINMPENLEDFNCNDIARAVRLGVVYGISNTLPEIEVIPDGRGRYNVKTDVLVLLVAHTLGLIKVKVRCLQTSSQISK